jgi:hypothetical protein
MTSWSTSALVVLAGVAAGPRGLNLLSPAVLLLFDPVIAMALGMLGIFAGLAIDIKKPRITVPAALAVVGVCVLAFGRTGPLSAQLLVIPGLAVVAILVAYAGWMLVGQADSEREQQVFVVGSLLLLGGSAGYSSLSALFAGLLGGLAWNAAGGLARARVLKHLEYFHHPLLLVMLLAAGASITFSIEALIITTAVVALHASGPAVLDPFPVSPGTIAIALALDVFRGAVP